MHQLILLKDFLFPHNFECIYLWLSSEFDELDSSEGAVAESGKDFKVVAFEFAEDELAILFEGG